MKPKKITTKHYNELHAQFARERVLNSELHKEIFNLKRHMEQKIDTHMMRERIELARALGLMIEATSKAVMFIVAKEAI